MTRAARIRERLDAAPARDVLSEFDAKGSHAGEAAVLMAITDRSEPSLILTQRHAWMRSHAGQVALPGGRSETEDKDLLETALRETEEEVALPRQSVEIVGKLGPLRSVNDLAVTPYVGIVQGPYSLVPSPDEVDAVFETPLDYLFRKENWQYVEQSFRGGRRGYYETMWQDRRIWGLTAAMIFRLADRIGDAWK